MNRLILVFVFAFVFVFCSTQELWAQRGGAKGRGGGRTGGMARSGASRAPSMSRAAPNRSQGARPSISRPNSGRPSNRPNVSRPSVGRPSGINSNQRPTTRPGTRPNTNRPNIGGGNRPNTGGGNRPNVGGSNRPNIGGGNRPNTGGNRPNIGGGNRPNTGGNNRPNIGGGNRPNVGGGNRPNIGGGNRPNTGGGNRPGRPSANDLGDFLNLPGTTRPSQRPGVGNRPGNNRPGNNQLGNNRPGNNRPGNNRPGNNRPGNNRPNIGDRTNVGDININAGNKLTINKQNNINSIRNHWNNVGVNQRPFNRNYWGNRPTTLPGWKWHGSWYGRPPSWYWRPSTWAGFGTWFAWSWPKPVVYSYGSNVVYRDNYVYVDNQQVASASEYYQQAETVATNIPSDLDAEQVEWMPLGVFAIAEENGTDSGMLIQLAISKEGIIAGTFYNDLTDISRPLEGSVDRDTQLAAWRFSDGENSDVVMETSIYNLTQEESTALVHFGADRRENWLLVQLPEPEEE